ncbi:MAG TPA: NlpC/P60 family protein [Solirubrobacteraceae bacterium]|nr:NlpC/P60 family protein [Solirubrobacteraceae bacterium]
MSLDAAIGQIDQIMQLQQQLADPGALASALASGNLGAAGAGSATGTAATGSGGAGLTTGSGATSFADVLAANQANAITGTGTGTGTSATTPGLAGSGLSDTLLSALTGTSTTPGTATTGTSTLAPTSTVGATATLPDAPARVQAMVQEANSLLGKPYVWGGGHGSWAPQAGYDCSGFVSAVLHAGGYLSAPQDTQTLPGQPGILGGPGQYVTIYDRTDAGMSADHVIIDIGGQFYESGGEHGAWGGGGGVQKIATPPASYLATFNRVLHPEGL